VQAAAGSPRAARRSQVRGLLRAVSTRRPRPIALRTHRTRHQSARCGAGVPPRRAPTAPRARADEPRERGAERGR
jgi:hypothetical protein